MNTELSNQKKDINKIETKCNLNNTKNDYFLQKVFNNLHKKNSLEIAKYNKKIKEWINLNINNYKEYCETYSSIEIELVPVKDKFGKFININEDNELYIHIFFNNNKKEIKRYYLDENDKVKKINIIIDYQVKSFYRLFDECKIIESIYFKKFYRNNLIDMWRMFSGCSSLKEINLFNFNTNNVTNMCGMFSGCSSLKEINLSNFNTNNVTDMGRMFSDCSSLKEINLSNFNTNNVTYMDGMFSDCSSLKEINLSNFNTNNVTYMNVMFFGCSSLKEINISNFNTNNVTNMSGMFSGCSDDIKNKIREQIKNIKEEAFK